MKLVLRVKNGPDAGRNATLRSGQFLRVGRSERADFGVAWDDAMSDLHFSVECGFEKCQVWDQGSDGGTLVNGQPISVHALRDTDLITAGQTIFSIEIEGGARHSPATDEISDAEGATVPGFAAVAAETAAEVCQHVDLEEEAQAHLRADLTPRQFLNLLSEHELFTAAIWFLAHALPAREAVWWATLCVSETSGETLSELDTAALTAAIEWVKQPDEENRRHAESAAKAIRETTAASWAAYGAFYSGGSLAPPGAPETPPGEVMTSAAVAAAVSKAGICDEWEEMNQTLKSLLEIGCEVADRGRPWD